jgi:hypothetical protein
MITEMENASGKKFMGKKGAVLRGENFVSTSGLK